MKIEIFSRPIAGQSLTTEPKNNPWENPAEMSDVEDITMFYIERMANDEVINDLAAVCDAGISLKPIVDTIISSAVMRGIHSIDAGMLVAPIIHEFLKQAISTTGVDVKNDGKDYQKEADQKEIQRFQIAAGKYLSENPDDGTDPGKALLSELVEDQPEEEDTPEDKPQGLMAKG